MRLLRLKNTECLKVCGTALKELRAATRGKQADMIPCHKMNT
jgi:hypothetical protein